MRKLRQPASIIGGMLLLMAFGGAYRVYSLFNSPSTSTIITNTAALKSVSDPAATRVIVNDPYATFTHAAFLTETPLDPPVLPLLSHYNFTKQQFGPWAVAVQITRLPTGSMNDSGTYNYRNKASGQFTKSSRTIGGYQTIIFNDVTSADLNQTAYFQKGTMLASVTISGGSALDTAKMEAELAAVIASWQWRQ